MLTCTAFNANTEDEGEDGDGDVTGDGDYGMSDGDGDMGMTDYDMGMVDASTLARNPCLDSPEVYHPYPYDDHLFVMCTGNMPFIMACSERLVWNGRTKTCDWPVIEPPEESEETDTDTV